MSLHAEEIRCGDGTPVRLEKGLPRHRLSPARSGLDAVLGEDALDGRPSEVEADVFERTAKARVAPRRILARHRQQVLHLVTSGGWPAGTSADTTPVVLRRNLLAVPPKDGLRCRERRHIGQQLSAERLSLLGQQPSLGLDESKTLGRTSRPDLAANRTDRFLGHYAIRGGRPSATGALILQEPPHLWLAQFSDRTGRGQPVHVTEPDRGAINEGELAIRQQPL